MRGRVMNVVLKPDLIDEAIAEWPKYAANFKGRGLESLYLLVDRSSGKALSVTIWESQEAIDTNEARAELKDALGRFERFYAAPPRWDYYDVGATLADA